MHGAAQASMPSTGRGVQAEERPLLQGVTNEIGIAIDNARSLASMLRSKAEQVFGPVPEPSRGNDLKNPNGGAQADELRMALSELHVLLAEATSQCHRLMRI